MFPPTPYSISDCQQICAAQQLDMTQKCVGFEMSMCQTSSAESLEETCEGLCKTYHRDFTAAAPAEGSSDERTRRRLSPSAAEGGSGCVDFRLTSVEADRISSTPTAHNCKPERLVAPRNGAGSLTTIFMLRLDFVPDVRGKWAEDPGAEGADASFVGVSDWGPCEKDPVEEHPCMGRREREFETCMVTSRTSGFVDGQGVVENQVDETRG